MMRRQVHPRFYSENAGESANPASILRDSPVRPCGFGWHRYISLHHSSCLPSCLHFTLKYTEAEPVGKCANPVPILRDSLAPASRSFRPLFRVKHHYSRMCAKICANLEKKSGAIQIQHLPLEPQSRKGFWWGWHSWHIGSCPSITLHSCLVACILL